MALRYTSMINGFTELAITKLDVLTGLDELKVCVAYRYDGKETQRFPTEVQTLERVEPVYETLPGWSEDLTGVEHYDDLQLYRSEDSGQSVVQELSTAMGALGFKLEMPQIRM